MLVSYLIENENIYVVKGNQTSKNCIPEKKNDKEGESRICKLKILFSSEPIDTVSCSQKDLYKKIINY